MVYLLELTVGSHYFHGFLYNFYTKMCGDSSQLTKYESEHFKGRGLDMRLGKGLREYNENEY